MKDTQTTVGCDVLYFRFWNAPETPFLDYDQLKFSQPDGPKQPCGRPKTVGMKNKQTKRKIDRKTHKNLLKTIPTPQKLAKDNHWRDDIITLHKNALHDAQMIYITLGSLF